MLFWGGDGFREVWWCGNGGGRCVDVWNGVGNGGEAAAMVGSVWKLAGMEGGWHGNGRIGDGGCTGLGKKMGENV